VFDTFIRNAIARWGRASGVSIDPALVRAIIQKESSGGKVAMSIEPGRRRSYGPMMVLDSTARGMGVTDPARLAEPGLGIWYGVRYLAEQIARFKGDTARAIAAYNAGPAVNRKASGSFPNQTYVNDVMRYWMAFRSTAAPVAALVAIGAVAWFLFARRRRAA